MSYLREHDEHLFRDGYMNASMIEIRSWLGVIAVQECEGCGYLNVECAHEKNTWDRAGQQLTCDLCGADGT